MPMSPARKKRCNRGTVATMMTVIYLFITLAPLLSPVLGSKTILHERTGACTGDCDTCGCSAERRASHSCCCWKKKAQAKRHEQQFAPECCKKEMPREERSVILSCGCPCDTDETAGVRGGPTSETLPFYFCGYPAAPAPERSGLPVSLQMFSRYSEPPDPPPRLV